MSNHSYIITRKNLSPTAIDENLNDILNRRFQGIFYSTMRGENWQIGCDELPDTNQFWLKTRRTLEFRHAMPDWANWLEAVIQNELASKYDGYIKFEGVSGKEEPQKDKFPTYTSWARYCGEQVFDDPNSIDRAIARRLRMFPECLKELL